MFQAEISRRESRRRRSALGAVESAEDDVKLDLRLLQEDEDACYVTADAGAEDTAGGVVTSDAAAAAAESGTIAVVASPTGSEDDRRLSCRSRESKDLEWENEWELAQQVRKAG